MRKFTAILMLLVLAIPLAGPLIAGSIDVTAERLIAWSNGDSNTQSSDWYPIGKDANRITFRMWSEHLAYVANTDAEADSSFSDTLAGMTVLFADSGSGRGNTGRAGQVVPWGVDTLQATMLAPASSDSANRSLIVYPWSVNKVLRSAVTGTGRYMYIAPLAPGSVTYDPTGVINARFVRVTFTPLRRATSATVAATVPRRVTGLRNFRIYASTMRANR